MSKARSIFRCAECGGRQRPSGRGGARRAASGTPWSRSSTCPRRCALAGWAAAIDRGRPHRRGRHRRVAARAPPASPSSTGCSAAGSCPGRSRCSAASPGIGKSTLLLQVASAGGRRRAHGASTSRPRSPSSRCGSGPSGSARSRPELWLASRDRAARTSLAAPRRGAARPGGRRLDPDRARPRARLGARLGRPGARVRRTGWCSEAKARGRRRGARRPRHQGRRRWPGPRVLEHVVDTVLAFEGDRHHALRLLRAVKHRFGSTDELGRVRDDRRPGSRAVPDPSGLFLADRRPGVPGSVVVPTLEGHRPLLVEVQALVAESPSAVAAAVGPGRRPRPAGRCCWPCSSQRAGVAVRRRRRLRPGRRRRAGASSRAPTRRWPWPSRRSLVGVPLPADLVACGEVGLGGELRQVAPDASGGWPRRPGWASRAAIVPRSAPEPPAGHRGVRGPTVARGRRAGRPADRA